MSMDATPDAPAPTPSPTDAFIADEAGRTLFYPFGESWHGYVVPDEAREQALRVAMVQYRANAKRFGIWPFFLAIPLFIAALAMFYSHPFLLLAAFVLPMALAILCDRAMLHYYLGPLLNGLKRAGSRNKVPGWIRQAFLAAATLVWITLQIYQQRVAALPVTADTIAFYADIAQPLMWALLCGFAAVVMASARNKTPAGFSGGKQLVVLLLLCFAEVCLVGYVATNVLTPAPRVMVSAGGLFCNWRVRWSDVTDVSQFSGRRGRQYARIKVGSEPQLSLWSSGNIKQCQITGLNEDYGTVYHAIRTAWLATRKAPNMSTGDNALDQIAIGASRQRVVAVLGSPTISAGTPNGTVSLYYDIGENAASLGGVPTGRHVNAIYFDTNGQVERVARYNAKDGKIFDAVSQQTMSSGAEFPLLYTLLIDKPRGG
jgi:SmpA / OmlA family